MPPNKVFRLVPKVQQGTDHIPEGGIARRKSLKPALVDAGGTRNTGAPNFLPPFTLFDFHLFFRLLVDADIFGGKFRFGRKVWRFTGRHRLAEHG